MWVKCAVTRTMSQVGTMPDMTPDLTPAQREIEEYSDGYETALDTFEDWEDMNPPLGIAWLRGFIAALQIKIQDIEGGKNLPG
jgi:hypothetical protein